MASISLKSFFCWLPAEWSSLIFETAGWAVLDVHSSPEADGGHQSYAAGFLEACLETSLRRRSREETWRLGSQGQGI